MSYGVIKIEDGEVKIIKPDGLPHVFIELIRRDRGSERDADGRKKYHFLKVYRYIYEIADDDSTVNKECLEGEEAFAQAKQIAGLEDSWTPDELVTQAIAQWKKDNSNPAKRLRNELLATFDLFPDTIRNIRKVLKKNIKSDNIEVASATLDYMRQVNNVAKDYTKLVQELAEAIVNLEVDKDEIQGRGGQKISPSMNPDTSI